MQKNRYLYRFIPKDAPSTWRRVRDITNGKGIRPFRVRRPDLIRKSPDAEFVELEEYRAHVPRCLRGKDGFPPDEVADMLGLEDSQALYKELDWDGRKPMIDIPEHEQEHKDKRLKEKTKSRKPCKRAYVDWRDWYDDFEVEEPTPDELFRLAIEKDNERDRELGLMKSSEEKLGCQTS